MADYSPIGPRTKTAAADTTGQNSGNYTASLSSADWAGNWPVFECAHILVMNVPILTQFVINQNSQPWDAANGGINSLTSWDGFNPLLLAPGDQVDFLFTLADTVTPAPKVVMWLRYDVSLPANAAIAKGG